MTSDLTPRQRSILEFIIAFQQQHRMAPTVREIGAHFGLSAPAGIHRILNILKDSGYILSEPGKKRSWRFSREVPRPGIPLIGKIAAGAPIEAIEHIEETLAIAPELFGGGPCFALRVQGDSMIDAHILDQDIAIIRSQPRVENGDIAAVLVQDLLPEATLKIVRWTRSTLLLEPANAAHETLVFKGPQRKQVTIVGKCVGVVRRA